MFAHESELIHNSQRVQKREGKIDLHQEYRAAGVVSQERRQTESHITIKVRAVSGRKGDENREALK